MKSSYLTNLILVLLIVGLYFFINQDDTDNNSANKLIDVGNSSIQTITITRVNIGKIVLEKSATDWQIIQPLTARANNIRIDLVLSLLHSPSHGQLSVGDHDLAQFGLAPAKVKLQLNQHIFQFGDIEPISKRRYVLHNNLVHLIDDQISPLLNASATGFIDNRLIPANRTISKLDIPLRDADKILLDSTIIIENKSDQWQSNISTITTDQLTILIEAWQRASALQVLRIKENQQQSIASHNIKIWYQDQEQPAEFQLQLTDKSLRIIDQQQQLTYQFPHALFQQLIPNTAVEP